MVASCSAIPARSPEAARQARFLAETDAAFRAALTESVESLAVCDRNMLRFHYFHGLSIDQLAGMFCSHRASVVRQLGRIRERVLRDLRRGLAARLSVDRRQLDQLLDVARRQLDAAITRILRA
jgi:RNA polymerase sigma-70 factor, ECF subfamily